MTLVAVRECASAADVMANARAVYARRIAIRPPKLEIVMPDPVIVYLEDSNSHMKLWREHQMGSLIDRVVKYRAQVDELLFFEHGPRPPVADFLRAVCFRFGIKWGDIVSCDRKTSVVLMRQKLMWLVRHLYGREMSTPRIGNMFERDASTCWHGINKIERMMAVQDPRVSDLRSVLDVAWDVDNSPTV